MNCSTEEREREGGRERIERGRGGREGGKRKGGGRDIHSSNKSNMMFVFEDLLIPVSFRVMK